MTVKDTDSIYLKAHIESLGDVSVSLCKGFTALVSTDCSGRGAAGLCQGDYVSVSFLGALMQNIAYLYIWFLFSIGFAVPVTMDEAKFPKEAYKSIAR